MSYTTKRQPQGILKTNEILFREGMIAEIVAINDYSYFITLTENKDMKNIFLDIMEDEKRHYGMFLDALRLIDEKEFYQYKKAEENIKINSKDEYKDGTGKGNKDNLLIHIREAIKGELEAIILYEDIIQHLDREDLKEIVEEITNEEKEHVEELTRALILLDKNKYGPISTDKAK